MDLKSVLASATQDGNVMEKIDNAAGKYKDNVADNKDTMSKLPQAQMPQAPDPSPFSIGPLSK